MDANDRPNRRGWGRVRLLKDVYYLQRLAFRKGDLARINPSTQRCYSVRLRVELPVPRQYRECVEEMKMVYLPARSGDNSRDRRESKLGLTNREMEVFEALATGKTHYEVAAALGIAYETIKNHVKIILLQMNAYNVAHAVAIAYAKGILIKMPLTKNEDEELRRQAREEQRAEKARKQA